MAVLRARSRVRRRPPNCTALGSGTRLGFQTEVAHRFGNGFVQRTDLVVRAPETGVPVMLLEIDRRTEDAHELVHKLRRYAD